MGCRFATPPNGAASAAGTPGPTSIPVAPPSPSVTPPPPPTAVASPVPGATPPVLSSAVPGPQQTGRTFYLGVNDVQDVAFAPDGTLWAATTGGAAQWDLEAGTYAQYGTADGLPSSYVTGVAFSPDGAVWLATLGGVARFSGSTWTAWSQADGLVSNAVQSIAVTEDGQVWIGTTEGIGRFDGDRWTTYLPGTRAYEIAVAPNGDLWFAGHGAGALRYEPGDDLWTAYAEVDGQPLAGVTALDVGPDGSVWIYENWQGVYRLDAPVAADADAAPWQKVQTHVAFVCAIAVATDGTPWLGTCGSMHSSFGNLMRWQEGGWQEIEGWHETGKPAIRAIAFGPDDAMAVATERGLAVRRASAWQTLRGGPSRNHVTTIAVTPDGAAWFGFGDYQSSPAGGGANRYDGDTWVYFLGNDNVPLLVVAPDGTLWAGAGCTVQRFDGTAWHQVGTCEDRGPGNVVDLAFGPAGEVWVATGMSLARFDGGSWQDMGKMVSSIAAAPDGTLWASGWEGAQDSYYVAYYDGSEWSKVLDRALASLTVTPDGSVWGIDAERGLVHFDGGTWQPVAGAAGLSALRFLAVGPDGALWAAGQEGFARLDGEAWITYPSGEGVQSMAIAPGGTVWLGTANGAVRVDLDTASR